MRLNLLVVNGLSPLARGTRMPAGQRGQSARFIPAGAGNTPERVVSKLCAGGLSPLARGTHDGVNRSRVEIRFIPAGAGNTDFDDVFTVQHAVYPRWRGEHPTAGDAAFSIHGLSPLARGTLVIVRSDYLLTRFIPAGAGNTQITVRGKEAVTVYPRWRGEHMRPRYVTIGATGLSPLARGTLRSGGVVVFVSRFIPAGAGNTGIIMQCRNWRAVYPRWRGEHCIKPGILSRNVGLSPLARGTHTKRYKPK